MLLYSTSLIVWYACASTPSTFHSFCNDELNVTNHIVQMQHWHMRDQEKLFSTLYAAREKTPHELLHAVHFPSWMVYSDSAMRFLLQMNWRILFIIFDLWQSKSELPKLSIIKGQIFTQQPDIWLWEKLLLMVSSNFNLSVTHLGSEKHDTYKCSGLFLVLGPPEADEALFTHSHERSLVSHSSFFLRSSTRAHGATRCNERVRTFCVPVPKLYSILTQFLPSWFKSNWTLEHSDQMIWQLTRHWRGDSVACVAA